MNVEELRNSRFLRFCVVGAGGAVVDFCMLAFGLHLLKLDPYSARALSYVFSATFTWWGNRQLTFAAVKSHGFFPALKEWATFFLASGIGGVANYGVYALCITFAPAPLKIPYAAAALGILAGLSFNFTVSTRVVFRAKS